MIIFLLFNNQQIIVHLFCEFYQGDPCLAGYILIKLNENDTIL